ncbi:MAG: hypothetical protein IT436_13590 [Phycisphaerales bacterium]|nr:hypothetical protein [Phycisphaerales bacterium]
MVGSDGFGGIGKFKSSLSPANAALLGMMHRLQYGYIEDLLVEKGEPVLKPMPRVVGDYKFGGESRKRAVGDDFQLKSEHIELVQLLRGLNNGRIERLEVKAGLPFRVLCAEIGLR